MCLSGTLEDKLQAAAAAGFSGVEIFEPDFVASPLSAAEVRLRCADLGLAIELYQPFRDLDSTSPQRFAENLRRAERKFELMERLGVRTILVCSSVAPDAVTDDAWLAEQLHEAASLAAERGLRIAYEALAWGRHVSTWDHSWRVVRGGDHPSLGLCLDSFHVLSRGSDPTPIADVPGEAIFFLQLADAPALDMGVLHWSRHYRLFPGQGAFDLPAFVESVLAAGYTGPLSLEVFNDVFRQAEPRHTAVDAMRSLLALYEAVGRRESVSVLSLPPEAPPLDGFAFTEIAVDETHRTALLSTLSSLGLAKVGPHRSKPVDLWEHAGARVLVNATPRTPQSGGGGEQPAEGVCEVAALGLDTTDPARATRRAGALLAPTLPRVRADGEADIDAIAAPDSTSLFFCGPGPISWRGDFEAPDLVVLPADPPQVGLTIIDHVALTQPFDAFDEATLFFRSVLGLSAQTAYELPAPFGLQRSRAFRNDAGTVRLPCSVAILRRGPWAPAVPAPQHIAFGCTDIVRTASALRSRGAPLLPVPGNYYDDLEARFDLDPGLLAALRDGSILYDRDEAGREFFHLYTEVIGPRLFFEVVQRVGGYDGYGAVNSPVHMAAHHHLRVSRDGKRRSREPTWVS